jgi:hypothetical protein
MASSKSIILIGPSKAGKTTLAKALSQQLQRPWLDLDDLRWDYYREIGYDHDLAQSIRAQGGMKALAEHWKPYDIHAVERVLVEYPEDHILSFGAGHSVYEDAEQFARAERALAPFSDIFLILPSLDIDEACALMRQRIFDDDGLPDDALDAITAINRFFMEHPSNRRLAHHVIVNAGKTVDQTCSEILALLNS